MKTVTFEDLPRMVGELIEKIDRLENSLQEHKLRDAAQPTDKLLSVKEAADFLNLAVPTVYSMVSKGDLPHMKRSKRLYFDRDELMAYLKEGRQQTNEEIEENALDCLTKKRRG